MRYIFDPGVGTDLIVHFSGVLRIMAEITIYTTMFCPFCHRAKNLLNRKGAEFNEIDVDITPGAREEMVTRAGGRRTVPQIFINGKHIGGSDELHELDGRGGLDPLLGAA